MREPRDVGAGRGEILTFPDTLITTQGLSLWSLNIVGGEILTFPDTLTTQGSLIPMVFEHSAGPRSSIIKMCGLRRDTTLYNVLCDECHGAS